MRRGICSDVFNNFKVLGVTARPLSGYERLKVLHGVFHPEGEPFSFSFDWLTPVSYTHLDVYKRQALA